MQRCVKLFFFLFPTPPFSVSIISAWIKKHHGPQDARRLAFKEINTSARSQTLVAIQMFGLIQSFSSYAVVSEQETDSRAAWRCLPAHVILSLSPWLLVGVSLLHIGWFLGRSGWLLLPPMSDRWSRSKQSRLPNRQRRELQLLPASDGIKRMSCHSRLGYTDNGGHN